MEALYLDCAGHGLQLMRASLGATAMPRLTLTCLLLSTACTQRPSASQAAAQQQAQWLSDASCLFDTTQTRSDPDQLAGEFVRRDAAGAFLQADAWFNLNTTCSGHEPGPDTHDAVAGYRMRPMLRTDTLVQYLVIYAGIGLIEYHQDSGGKYREVWTPAIREYPETLTAVRTSYGWRIRSPALWQHVLADTVLRRSRILPPTNASTMQRVLDSLRARGWDGGA